MLPFVTKINFYIIPPISGIPPGGIPAGTGDSLEGSSETIHSVVIIIPPTDPAACKAVLVTLAGSMIHIFKMSPYSPVAALNPSLPLELFTFSATTDASSPAFEAIVFSGYSKALKAILIPAC